MVTRMNDSKILTKDISCECKCRFHGKICNSEQRLNNNKCWCECKKHQVCEKDYMWNHATCTFENGKYLASFMNDLTITYDEIIDAKAKSNNEEVKTILANFN